MIRCALTFVLCVTTCVGNAQTFNPVIGQNCPDFTLNNIIGYPLKQTTLKDFKGKWLVMDFWALTCGACIAGLPGKNVMQKELGDRVQVMLVAVDEEAKTKNAYAVYKKRMNLELPYAFDSTLANRIDFAGLPYILVIDPNGVVQAITTGINSKKMQELIAGSHPELSRAYNNKDYASQANSPELIPYDAAKPFLVNGNGAAETDFLYRSVLSEWDPVKHQFNMESSLNISDWSINPHTLSEKGRFELLGASLERLYQLAWFGRLPYWNADDTLHYGQYFPRIIYETKDSTRFNKQYSYSLTMIKEKCSVDAVQNAMQKDLDIYFGYEASIETRKFPVYKFIADDGATNKLKTTIKLSPVALKSRESKKAYKESSDFYNQPFSEVLRWTRDRVKDNTKIAYVEDATGIEGNVNLQLNCVDVDFTSIQKSLAQYGLHLALFEKEMKVLVIKDK